MRRGKSKGAVEVDGHLSYLGKRGRTTSFRTRRRQVMKHVPCSSALRSGDRLKAWVSGRRCVRWRSLVESTSGTSEQEAEAARGQDLTAATRKLGKKPGSASASCCKWRRSSTPAALWRCRRRAGHGEPNFSCGRGESWSNFSRSVEPFAQLLRQV